MNARPAAVRALCLAGVVLVLTGCLNLNKGYPEKRSFVLDVGAVSQDAAPNSAMVVKISKFRVSPLFAGRAMVYRTADLQYESDFYGEWFVAPGALVTQQVHEWLSKSGRFQFVLMGTNHIEPTHLLEGTVTEFYGDYRGSPKATLGIELHLLDGLNERQVVFRQTYRKDVPLADQAPESLAGGLSQAMRQVLLDFEKDLATVPVGPPRKGDR